jgi:phosphatidylethanolamine-binding protein
MNIIYKKKIINSLLLTPSYTKLEPTIYFKTKPNTYYTLIMYDPDAFYGNKIHWLVVNITEDSKINGDVIFKYKGPKPPKNTGTHRYIFLIYKQQNIYNFDKLKQNIIYRYISMNYLLQKLNLINKPIYTTFFTSKFF